MELTTERLILREFQPTDWQAVMEYQSDPLYLRFYPWEDRSEYDVKSFVQMFVIWQRESPRRKYQLAILLPDDHRLIGNIGVRMNQAGDRVAEMGYEIAPPYWGRGYATEAARAMLTFAFDTLHLHRVWANCISENTASARVLEKIGMQLEGELRQNEWFKGRWWNTRYYGILDKEWRAREP